MIAVRDQLGREVTLPSIPQRIISLVPSQTELLFDLGLADEIVGVTKFCVHPKTAVKGKQSVGGTKKFRFDVIEQLRPDLIIGNKEENYPEGIAQLGANYPVWMSDVKTLPEALMMIEQVGILTGRKAETVAWRDRIKVAFGRVVPVPRLLRVGYFIWQRPYMAVGDDTFINDMLRRCGFINPFAEATGRYPEVSEADIEAAQLDLVLLSSEPFPFKVEHQVAWQARWPQTQVLLADGEMFSWYGSRLVQTAVYLQTLIEML